MRITRHLGRVLGVMLSIAVGIRVLPGFAQDARSTLRALCTDRPTKSTGPCTVDQGHFQIESDLFNVVIDHTGGVDTNTYLITNPTLKYGVAPTLDFEVSLAPVAKVTTHDRASGQNSDTVGVGDLYFRAKWNLVGDDAGAIGLALAPYLKIPTARRGIGNGAAEGGLIAAASVNLPAKFSLSLAPEVDLLEDGSGLGRHANLVNLVGLSHPVGPVVLAAELWSDIDFDPARTVTQYSADLGVSWTPATQPDLQFDGGVNLGLNRVTPGTQIYVGVSHRF